MQISYPVIILAGGLATRLRPITETIPKALILIHNEPFIYHQLRLLKRQGIRQVILCVGYLGDMIEQLVGNGHSFGLDVKYVYDGPQLLGTAGAIKQALHLVEELFFVLYGDSYLPCNYMFIQQQFLVSKKQALMTVFHNQNKWDKSNVEYKEGLIVNYDKQNPCERMQHIDYGLGMYYRQVFDTIQPEKAYDLSFIQKNLVISNQLAGLEITERFYEIGSFEGINELEVHIKNRLVSTV